MRWPWLTLLFFVLGAPVWAFTAQALVVINTTTSFYLVDNGTYINASFPIYADQIDIYTNAIMFQNARLGSETNPALTFWLSVSDGNATITNIASNSITIVVEAPTGVWSTLEFRYSGNYPPYVVLSKPGGYSHEIRDNDYFRDHNAFLRYPSEAVFLNETGSYILLKAQHASPVTWTIYFLPPAPSGGGGGGVAFTTPAPADTQPPIVTIQEPQDTTKMRIGLVIIVIAVIGAIANSTVKGQKLSKMWEKELNKTRIRIKWQKKKRWWE